MYSFLLKLLIAINSMWTPLFCSHLLSLVVVLVVHLGPRNLHVDAWDHYQCIKELYQLSLVCTVTYSSSRVHFSYIGMHIRIEMFKKKVRVWFVDINEVNWNENGRKNEMKLRHTWFVIYDQSQLINYCCFHMMSLLKHHEDVWADSKRISFSSFSPTMSTSCDIFFWPKSLCVSPQNPINLS